MESTSASVASSTASITAYETLLHRIADLEGDLQQAVGTADVLKRDNDLLRSNYEKVKSELLSLKAQYDEVRGQAFEESQARIATERKHEALIREWTAQLEVRQKEFDALQAQLQPPRDLEMLKLQVTEELSAPYKSKMAQYEGELAQTKAAYNALQREYEALRAEHEAFASDQSREAEAAYESQQAAVAELHKTISDLQAQIDDNNSAVHADLRTVRAQLEACKTKLRMVEAEADDLAASKSEMRAQLETTTLTLQREASELRSQMRLLEMERSAWETRAVAAESQAVQLQSTNVQISARASMQANELTRLQSTIATSQKAFEDEIRQLIKQQEQTKSELFELRAAKDNYERQLRNAERHNSSELTTALAVRDEKQARLNQLEEQLADAQDELRSARWKAEQAEAQLAQRRRAFSTLSRRNSLSEANEIPSSKTIPPKHTDATKTYGANAETGFAWTVVQQAEAMAPSPDTAGSEVYDIDAALALASKRQAEAETLRSAIADLRAQNAELKVQLNKAQSAMHELAHKKDQSEQLVQELTIRVNVAETELRTLRELSDTADQRSALSRDLVEEQRRALQIAAEASRRELESALDSCRREGDARVAAQTEESLRAMREVERRGEASRRAAAAARAKAQAYKEKLLALYKLYSEAKEKFAESHRAAQLIASSRDAELAAVSKQLKELIREREMMVAQRGGASLRSTTVTSALTPMNTS